jgi:hypothetical protein
MVNIGYTRRRQTKHTLKPTQYVLDTTKRKPTQITSIRQQVIATGKDEPNIIMDI